MTRSVDQGEHQLTGADQLAIHTRLGLDLAEALALELDRHNRERQALEAGILESASAMALTQQDNPFLLVAGDFWHPGVVGIVAAWWAWWCASRAIAFPGRRLTALVGSAPTRPRSDRALWIVFAALLLAPAVLRAQIAAKVVRTRVVGIDVIAYRTAAEQIVTLRGSLPAGEATWKRVPGQRMERSPLRMRTRGRATVRS